VKVWNKAWHRTVWGRAARRKYEDSRCSAESIWKQWNLCDSWHVRWGEECTTEARATILGNSKKTTCPVLTSLLNSRFARVTLVCFIHKSRTLLSVVLSLTTTSNCTRQNLPDYTSSTYINSFYRHKSALYNTLQLSERETRFLLQVKPLTIKYFGQKYNTHINIIHKQETKKPSTSTNINSKYAKPTKKC